MDNNNKQANGAKPMLAAVDIPKIVKEYVLKHCKRMPETQQEIDQYLDLINHSKEYAESIAIQNLIGKKLMKQWGFKSPNDIKKEGKLLFNGG